MNSRIFALILALYMLTNVLGKEAFSQQPTEYQQLQYLKQASEVLGSFEAESSVYLGTQTTKDEADKAMQSLQSNIDPKAQFFNDITKGSPTFDYNQYLSLLNLILNIFKR